MNIDFRGLVFSYMGCTLDMNGFFMSQCEDVPNFRLAGVFSQIFFSDP